MRALAPVLLGIAITVTPVAHAQAGDTPVVVELFTSQGCSSCPPADKILADLANRDDVIALALHVGYWDYIGWKDEFADPAHDKRQRDYARTGGRSMIYTPQMIVGGIDHVEGAKAMKVMDEIEAARKSLADVGLRLSRQGDRLTIRANRTRLDEPVRVQLVRFDLTRRVKITRGENRGRTFDYSNVVTSWQVLNTWDGTSALAIAADVPGDEGIAVLLQNQGPGLIIAAAQLR